MTEHLKPCPFCGGKPYLANVDMAGCAYVVCTDCRMQSDDGTQSRVVAAWNTRADLADPRVLALVKAAQNAHELAHGLAFSGSQIVSQWAKRIEEETADALATLEAKP